MPDTQVNYDPISEWNRNSRQRLFLQVKRLGVENGLIDVEQIAMRIGGTSQRRNQVAIDLPIEASEADAVLFGLGIGVIGSEIKKILAVGKKERPTVGSVEFGIQMRDGGDHTGADVEDL